MPVNTDLCSKLLDAGSPSVIVEWTLVSVRYAQHEITFVTLRDAVRINGIRVSADALETQRVADRLGARLATPRLVDLRYLAAKRNLKPVFRIDNKITARSTDKRHSLFCYRRGTNSLVSLTLKCKLY